MNPAIGDTDGGIGRPKHDPDERPARDHEDAHQRTERVCVVGLGYVGLPLAVGFDRVGHAVAGYDVDEAKVGRLRDGTDTTGDLGDDAVAESDATFTTDPASVARADYVMIAVPTPVDEHDHPDLRYVEAAARTVGEHATPGTTVVLESTVYPGATREVVLPAVAEASGLEPGEEFGVAYSPERATPGDPDHDLRSVVKIVGGQTDAIRDDVADLYESVVDAGVHRAPSIEVAEAAKVVENVQRDLNIALVNELAVVFDRLDADVDTHAVLEAAGTKWNFHEYRPGLVGGHCIPVDPHFLAYQAERAGMTPELVLAGRRVNESMPEHVAWLTVRALNANGKTLRDSRVLVLGYTYKADVSDSRTSKVDDVVDRLRDYEIDVTVADPHVEPDAVPPDVDVRFPPSFEGYDGVVLATPHAEFRSLDLADAASTLADDPVLVDLPGALDEAHATDAGFTYRSL